MAFTAVKQGLIGEVRDYYGLTAPTGWLVCGGSAPSTPLTIGSSNTAATGRANNDVKNLFIHLWNNSTNAELAVSGGRGADALADWTLDKTIQLPDIRGRSTIGKDDMGGSAASRITSAGSGITGTTLGAAGGAQTNTLTAANIEHNHSFSGTTSLPGGGSSVGVQGSDDDGYNHSHTYSGNVSAVANNTATAHNNTQPSLVVLKIIKY